MLLLKMKFLAGLVVLLEITISAAEENFSLYLEVNEPSTSIVQDKPQFSNIENGLGIFSSRAYTKTFKKVHPESMAYLMALYPYLKFDFNYFSCSNILLLFCAKKIAMIPCYVYSLNFLNTIVIALIYKAH